MKSSYKVLLSGLVAALVSVTSFAGQAESKATAGLQVVQMSAQELATTEGKGCLSSKCAYTPVKTGTSIHDGGKWSYNLNIGSNVAYK
jgi:hypothetical protein